MAVRTLGLPQPQHPSTMMAIHFHFRSGYYSRNRFAAGGPVSFSSFLTGEVRPASSRAGQARCGGATLAAAFACAARYGGLRHGDTAFAAADQTRNDIARRDGPLPRPTAPCTQLGRIASLWLAHLLSFLKARVEADRRSGTQPSPKSMLAVRRGDWSGGRGSIECRSAAGADIWILPGGRVWLNYRRHKERAACLKSRCRECGS